MTNNFIITFFLEKKGKHFLIVSILSVLFLLLVAYLWITKQFPGNETIDTLLKIHLMLLALFSAVIYYGMYHKENYPSKKWRWL